MKKKFITFGGPSQRYHDNVIRICKEVEEFDYFDEVLGFTENDLILDVPFWNAHHQFILTNNRGFGYWIWKSYLINKELEKMNYGDILVYADSGCKINKKGKPRFLEYIEMLEKDTKKYGLISFQLQFKEKQYTKRLIFDFFKIPLLNFNEDIKNLKQCVGGIQIIKKTIHSSNLIKLWSMITQNYILINDMIYSDEDIEFVENRHDQSIYSILVNRFGSIKIPDETYFEDIKKADNYPILACRL